MEANSYLEVIAVLPARSLLAKHDEASGEQKELETKSVVSWKVRHPICQAVDRSEVLICNLYSRLSTH